MIVYRIVIDQDPASVDRAGWCAKHPKSHFEENTNEKLIHYANINNYDFFTDVKRVEDVARRLKAVFFVRLWIEAGTVNWSNHYA